MQLNVITIIIMQDLQETISGTSGGDVLSTESTHLVNLAFSLLLQKVPSYWISLVGYTAPPASWPFKEWMQDLVLRFVFLDRVLITGLPRTPTYWLGAFFNPRAFLSVIQQVGNSYIAICSYSCLDAEL